MKVGANKLRNLERSGNFRGVVRLLAGKEELLSFRELASLARAHAFSDKIETARKILAQLPPGIDDEIRAIALLAQARIHRAHVDWESSHGCCERALEIARRIEDPYLAAEAEFALAIGLVERGRLFYGLDIFQRIASDSSLPEHRRNMALSNQAWILWDLGRTETYRQILPRIPEEYRVRHELADQLCRGDLALANELIRKGLPPVTSPSQRFPVAHLLTMGAAVLGSDKMRQAMLESWIAPVLENDLEGIGKQCLQLLRTPGGPEAIPAIQAVSWRQQLESGFFSALIAARALPSHSIRGREIYRRQVNPVIDDLWLKTPLIPKLTDRGFEENTPWNQALAAKLGLATVAQPEIKPQLILSGRRVVYYSGSVKTEVDLRRSPTSLKLMQALSSQDRGAPLSKAEIHRKLTRSSYLPTIHDGRILKLLSRLESRLSGAGIPRPWDIPGDNTIVLNTKVEVHS